MTAAQIQRNQLSSQPSTPLDTALERLRCHGLPYRWDERHLSTWHAVCPFCRVADWTLALREHGYRGPVAMRCAAGCTEQEIQQALEREPSQARIEAAETRATEAIELAEQARDLAARALTLAAHEYQDPVTGLKAAA